MKLFYVKEKTIIEKDGVYFALTDKQKQELVQLLIQEKVR